MNNYLKGLLIVVSYILSPPLYAKTHEISMLNSSSRGVMVFEPSVVHASVGDTVVFLPKQMGGHNTQSHLIPTGASSWKGGMDAKTTVSIDKPGVYFYVCQPHLPMGMVGFIVVDNNLSNFDEVKQTVMTMRKTWVMNKERVKEDLDSIAADN